MPGTFGRPSYKAMNERSPAPGKSRELLGQLWNSPAAGPRRSGCTRILWPSSSLSWGLWRPRKLEPAESLQGTLHSLNFNTKFGSFMCGYIFLEKLFVDGKPRNYGFLFWAFHRKCFISAISNEVSSLKLTTIIQIARNFNHVELVLASVANFWFNTLTSTITTFIICNMWLTNQTVVWILQRLNFFFYFREGCLRSHFR